ncbi:Hsp70 family protein [Actinomadura meridiana]|uniref:Hsp70 family protein n=1 Tax=Actinomadura meridiana TaxID=559626 RepID=A0ABP8C2J9_9ACTN
MSDSTIFGIDLGTTHSCIAYIDEASGKPIVVANAEGDLTTPSVVLFDDTETRVVGKEAKNAAVMYADRVVSMVKRQMGVANWRFPIFEQDYTAEEISSYILRKLAADAEALLAAEVEKVVITCPAYFGISEREATAKAGKIAGLDVQAVLNEPTAAAIAFGMHNDSDQTVLVYDLGGGTFDVTMIEVRDGSVRVVATGGDHRLGGRDWDEAVVNYLAERWQQDTDSAEDPRDSEETLQDLWQHAEDGKRSLSARAEARIMASHAGHRVAVPLTREKFDELTAHLLERTVEYTRTVIGVAAERGIGSFDKLLLVGGSTKMPQVAARLNEVFGVTPQSYDPDQSVAKGAAVYGQKLMIGERIKVEIAKIMGAPDAGADDEQVPSEVKKQAVGEVAAQAGLRDEDVEKFDKMEVTNVASHSFGIVVLSDSEGRDQEVISNLVVAQDPVPASKTRTYATVTAGQSRVDIRVMENSSGDVTVPLAEGRPIGKATLKLSRGLPGGSPVDITFELEADGRLKVTGQDVADPSTEISAVIKTDRGLSEEELRLATARAQGIRVNG